ncbi:MAG: hypothetical protein PHV74_07440 [Dehalococcoidia bacterium]|nr:hypothetical protein [Dehalococcoidia bacterium]
MSKSNSEKAELALEIITRELGRPEIEPSRIIDRISGCESSYMGCPQRS